ncbi:MAG: helix-turn-helix domain-containing protein [Prevotella sp.]|jgi:AraC-like DNA-binding protein|uniref:helix-turn-helix domain-containing protein n=1 Tax=unclassified Dysgonomonas TaxID=2630389 RepID=UPI0025BC4B6C|nr:helix-turn-helix domain-containing protein [Dysgonomonas sp. UBA7710]MDR1715841.1 helix-turn-helix domain-containing protein [Prevotella sp.]MDR2002561.1 helix-turn-helix domain-containing protein [Prevotella sp.]HMM01924.1 helix-turn-helix domain-containing protein [Dysgonomonas sp.]
MAVDEKRYAKISLEDIVNQNSIPGIQNFIISEEKAYIKNSSVNFQNSFFDLKYPHVCEGIGFAICTKGKARIRINLREYQLESSSIIALLPNYIIQILEQDENLEIEFLMFSFDFVSDTKMITDSDFIEKIQQAPFLKIDEETVMDLLEFHAFIVKQYKKTNYDEVIMKNLLVALINKVLLIHQESEKGANTESLTHKEKIFQRFLALLFRYYKKERTIKFYAEKLLLTPSHLTKVIREASQKSVSQWIDEMVIMSAKAMLKSSDMTVSQIAEELNFANPSFFSTYFKKRTGVTPLQYKES